PPTSPAPRSPSTAAGRPAPTIPVCPAPRTDDPPPADRDTAYRTGTAAAGSGRTGLRWNRWAGQAGAPRGRRVLRARGRRAMRGDGDGWAFGPDGARHWGVHGAAGLLLRAPGEGAVPLVLLQHRAAWSHEGGTWSIPGGARDSHETTEQAAVREAAEESGLPAASIRVRGELRTAGDPAHWTYTTVYADAARRLDTVANAESLELAWVPEDEVD